MELSLSNTAPVAVLVVVATVYVIYSIINRNGNDEQGGESPSAPFASPHRPQQRPKRIAYEQKPIKTHQDRKKPELTPAEQTIEEATGEVQKIKQTLIDRRSVIQKKIEKEVALAKSHSAKKNRQMAKNALIRKKHYEKQLTLIDDQLSKIEAQEADLVNNSQAHDLAEIISEVKEQRAVADKIADAFSSSRVSNRNEADESALMFELEQIMNE